MPKTRPLPARVVRRMTRKQRQAYGGWRIRVRRPLSSRLSGRSSSTRLVRRSSWTPRGAPTPKRSPSPARSSSSNANAPKTDATKCLTSCATSRRVAEAYEVQHTVEPCLPNGRSSRRRRTNHPEIAEHGRNACGATRQPQKGRGSRDQAWAEVGSATRCGADPTRSQCPPNRLQRRRRHDPLLLSRRRCS